MKKPDSSIPTKTSTTPVKKVDTISRLMKKFPKPSPPKFKKKNIASARMSRIEAELSSESIEDNISSLKSPNSSQTETKPKVDLKSPNWNDSKGSTQSPNNEQSAASPSQFFAANKIISSMKAQLQEEYSQKEKPKDTFADIEQGICSQVTEYPYMKHPATPPQFSEASKLVSAIKSKLSYKGSKEIAVPVQFNSARDRLESLRRSLTNEAMEIGTERSESRSQYFNLEMEVDLQEVGLK